ncbi:hypothetical protein BDP27DRAFT_1449728 [Rhodocollybia butyracea]|uniref:Uncharacterized protein n=1 Tax=Rhodocollybia butyracea TaxID=206335 RepID=A0A9P5PR71_9AGAR|nr:hypothetical protein BDP27DRAFT_1449728 [Rhodocollybia butyracea]
MQTLTWKDFLHFSPSCCPQLGKIPNEKASTAPDTFSACHAPNASKLLRQSSPDLSEKDFSSHDPLPSDVAAILRHLEFTISRAVIITGEGDATMMLAQWLGAAGIILDVLDIRLRSVQPSLRISKQGDQNLTSFEINQEEPSKGVGIQVEKPSVLASYCADLVQPHEYTPERQENGRATLVKLDLQVQHNPPSEVGIIVDAFRVVFVEYVTLGDPQKEHRAAIVSKAYGIVPCPSPSHFTNNSAYLRIPTPKYPILVNPIQACNPSKWTGKLDIQLMPMPGLAEMALMGRTLKRRNSLMLMNHSWSGSSDSSRSSSDSNLEGNANETLQLGNYASTWKGVFGPAHNAVIFKFT